MSRFTIEKAVRRGNKARVALSAPAGGGKTYTALTLAGALARGGDVLVIDTERGSASLYAEEFDFQVIQWTPPYDPVELSKVIREVGPSFAVVIVDSLSHFWMGEGGTLDVVDAAGARARGNSYAGWKAGTPVQNSMVDAMLNAPCHVIATMRSKTEYVLEAQANGKTAPRKVGMAPVQRDGIEYEFTVTADLDIDHLLMVGKTRCSALAGRTFRPGQTAEMGQVLAEWLDGAEAVAPPAPEAPSESDRPFDDADRTLVTTDWIHKFRLAMAENGWDPKVQGAVVWHGTGGRTRDPKAVLRAEMRAVAAARGALDAGRLAESVDDAGVVTLVEVAPAPAEAQAS